MKNLYIKFCWKFETLISKVINNSAIIFSNSEKELKIKERILLSTYIQSKTATLQEIIKWTYYFHSITRNSYKHTV